MVDWWAEYGPPVYIAAAAYMGLIKKKSQKKTPQAPPKPFDQTNPFTRMMNESSKETGNLEELAKMFSGNNGYF